MSDNFVPVDLSALHEDVVRILPEDRCRAYMAIAVDRIGKVLVVAISDPSNRLALDDIRFMTGFEVEARPAPASVIHEAINRYYGVRSSAEGVPVPSDIDDPSDEGGQDEASVDLSETVDDPDVGPIVKLTNAIIGEALRKAASDIHIEPVRRGLRVRYRIDGLLLEQQTFPLRLSQSFSSRVKILAKCDIAEKRRPQDGTIDVRYEGRPVRVDVSVLPTAVGERIVMRIRDKQTLILDLEQLGFSRPDIQRIHQAATQPTGMVLVAGPRGSGPKSTLYALLARLNTPETCILTAENPIEAGIDGVSQVQIKEEIGYTYAAALGAFVTQDPDVIMLQELRDAEVAKSAVLTSLDSCVVLTSLAADDASGALSRLLDWGVQPTLVGTAVRLVIAQRGMRRLCEHCRVKYTPLRDQLERAGILALAQKEGGRREISDIALYRKGGCSACANAGYRGRLLVYEIMTVSPGVREAILRGSSRDDIRGIAIREGMQPLADNALRHVLDGRTSLEECLKIL